MFLQFSTLGLLPFLIVQGYQVKKNTIRLPEADGIRSGVTGNGQALSVLIVGDSASAGVGVQKQQDALLGALLATLQDHFKVEYCLEAKSGDTTLQVHDRMKKLTDRHFDIVITSVGVNDVTKLMSPKKWIQQQKDFYCEIEQKFSPNLVLVTGVPPMNLFPALPNPLAWLFGKYSSEMNEKLAQFIVHKPNYQLIQFDLAHFKALNLDMAEDGFHPSKEIYQLWGNTLADKIKCFKSNL